jgi:hypothetical protein
VLLEIELHHRLAFARTEPMMIMPLLLARHVTESALNAILLQPIVVFVAVVIDGRNQRAIASPDTMKTKEIALNVKLIVRPAPLVLDALNALILNTMLQTASAQVVTS